MLLCTSYCNLRKQLEAIFIHDIGNNMVLDHNPETGRETIILTELSKTKLIIEGLPWLRIQFKQLVGRTKGYQEDHHRRPNGAQNGLKQWWRLESWAFSLSWTPFSLFQNRPLRQVLSINITPLDFKENLAFQPSIYLPCGNLQSEVGHSKTND